MHVHGSAMGPRQRQMPVGRKPIKFKDMYPVTDIMKAHLEHDENEIMSCSSTIGSRRSGEAGFSLIEVAVAMVVILVALLGVFFSITYAITFNAGNNSRAQAVAVLQREVERLRSAKYTPGFTDVALYGGTTTQTTVVNGLTFSVTTVTDNDPTTPSVIEDETAIASAATSFKEIKITARLANPSPGWQTAIPATVVLRRVKSN
jgi:prepilin-type N-terminal cleavage/methylation domain-containing protein